MKIFQAGARGAAALVSLWLAVATPATAGDSGLVTALDRIGGNLLGPAAFDAVLFDPQPDPPAVRLYLSTEQAQPVEIVLVTAATEANPPEPIRAFFRMTVGGGGARFEYDPNAGDIIPCVLPPEDLSVLPAAPRDAGNGPGSLRPGLVTALGEVGKDLLGSGFSALLTDPPDPVQPQRLRIYIPRTSRVELVLVDPPDPVRTVFRMVVGGPEVTLQLDDDAVSSRAVRIEPADLSSVNPPDPVHE